MPYTPLQMADAFIQAGELSDAVDALTQHLDASPGDDEARRLRAQVYLRLRSDVSYRAALDDLHTLSNSTVDDEITRATALEYLADRDGALQALERARAARPDDERIAERYFFMLLGRAKWAEARSLLDTMPRTWDWLEKAGDLASESEGPAQAIVCYDEALDHLETQFNIEVDAFAQSIKSHILAKRAQMYATAGQFAEADADYASAETLTPDDPMLKFWHSLVVCDMGDEARALVICRAAFDKAGESWRAQMVQTLRVMREGGRYATLADAMLKD
jgi:tetratricopeptide (TPR) repeat protein